jgi:hypothetical protein
MLRRDEQLGSPSVRRFIADMERPREFNGKFVSIFSLMRDGSELAEKLRDLRQEPPADIGEWQGVIDPYVQVVVNGARCSQTGLRLMDIWRYFRHTWTNHYVSTPGRTMLILVRDRAVPFHPVIGIAARSPGRASAPNGEVLSDQTFAARKNARKGLSPDPASRCSSLQPRFGQLAARFCQLQLVAAREAGLLISGTWGRIPPGPLRFAGVLRRNNQRDLRTRVLESRPPPITGTAGFAVFAASLAPAPAMGSSVPLKRCRAQEALSPRSRLHVDELWETTGDRIFVEAAALRLLTGAHVGGPFRRFILKTRAPCSRSRAPPAVRSELGRRISPPNESVRGFNIPANGCLRSSSGHR